MALDELADLLTATVTVRPSLGTGSTGPVYGPEVTLSPDTGTGVMVDDETRLVRAPDGSEVVSSTTIVARPAQAATLTVGSLVTLRSGRTTTVLTLARTPDLGDDLDMPEHVEAACE